MAVGGGGGGHINGSPAESGLARVPLLWVCRSFSDPAKAQGLRAISHFFIPPSTTRLPSTTRYTFDLGIHLSASNTFASSHNATYPSLRPYLSSIFIMPGGKGKSIGGKGGPKDAAGKTQKSHSAKAGLQVSLAVVLMLLV